MGSSSYHSCVLLTRLVGVGLGRSCGQDNMQDTKERETETCVLQAPEIESASGTMLVEPALPIDALRAFSSVSLYLCTVAFDQTLEQGKHPHV